jgi:glutathionyl-hydroquinone reductase
VARGLVRHGQERGRVRTHQLDVPQLDHRRHFKCNRNRIEDFPNLSRFLQTLYRVPGIAATVNMDHIKRHYYMSHEHINPTRIVPVGPRLKFMEDADTAARSLQ